MKAWDLKELVEELKSRGLDLAEDAAVQVYEAVDAWVIKSASASENKMDDMLLAVMPIAKGYVMEQIDKIDGKVDLAEPAE